MWENVFYVVMSLYGLLGILVTVVMLGILVMIVRSLKRLEKAVETKYGKAEEFVKNVANVPGGMPGLVAGLLWKAFKGK